MPRKKSLHRRRRARQAFTIIEVLIAVSIIGILLNMAARPIRLARYKAQARSCTANLRRIAYAKNTYMMEKNVGVGAAESTFTDALLYGTNAYLKKKPTCPNNGTYSVGDGSSDPSCNYGSGLLHTFTGQEVFSAAGSGKY